jgi:hypothetical protein
VEPEPAALVEDMGQSKSSADPSSMLITLAAALAVSTATCSGRTTVQLSTGGQSLYLCIVTLRLLLWQHHVPGRRFELS